MNPENVGVSEKILPGCWLTIFTGLDNNVHTCPCTCCKFTVDIPYSVMTLSSRNTVYMHTNGIKTLYLKKKNGWFYKETNGQTSVFVWQKSHQN